MGLRWLSPLAGLVVAACSMIPADSPAVAVRGALDRVVARDLPGASMLVCADRQNARDFPFMIPGIFEQVGALPGFDIPRTLTVMTLDTSRLNVVDAAAGPGVDLGQVSVTGTLVITFDPPAVEALFRAMAAESGQPLDQELLDMTMANVSGGPVELDLDEVVRVVREGGAWRVCPLAPTP
jgi:hypothetical protein